MTTEGDKFQMSAIRTAIHSSAKSRIATVNHFFNVHDLCGPGQESVFDFFIMITKDFLKYIHVFIMQESVTKNKSQTPHE